jgi:hypothetical protein
MQSWSVKEKLWVAAQPDSDKNPADSVFPSVDLTPTDWLTTQPSRRCKDIPRKECVEDSPIIV